MNPEPVLIAELGATHIGDMDRARKLILLAKESGANIVKFQKRCPKESVPQKLWNEPHPNEFYSYGKTYLEHREKLELSQKQHAELKKHCERIEIEYFCSVWDQTSAKEIIELEPKRIKIPSAMNTNWSLIKYLYNNFTGEVHISLGMVTPKERQEIINRISDEPNHFNRTVFYHCTSIYPCPFEKLYLNEIRNLVYLVGRTRVGLSNHGYGISSDIAALALGATWFERHFIDDRSFPHSDSAASLEPGGLSKLSRDLKNVAKALRDKPDNLEKEEIEQRKKLRG
jgi:N-acetylneuraminate synthase